MELIMETPYKEKKKRKNLSPVRSIESFVQEMRKNKSIYLMFVPAMVLLFLFNYMPLSGLVLAFKDVSFAKGIWGSDWAEPLFTNFEFLFSSDSSFRAFRNTLILNGTFIVTGLICEVGLALLLNLLTVMIVKKVVQSITILPYFVSWIVVGVFSYNILSTDNGALNSLFLSLGLEKIEWYSSPEFWPAILSIVMRWKWTGYGAIIYLASLSGIPGALYEAAEIDGASEWTKTWKITIPMIRPTIIVMVLLQIGRIMNADFGMFYAIVGDASLVFPTADVIDTFVYRGLKQTGDIGMASAAGFIQSLISFLLVLSSNWIARRVDPDSAIF